MARTVSAFREFPAVNKAYGHVRERFQRLIRLESRPELGAIDLPLWHYMHSCVPSHLNLPDLGKGAVGIGPRCRGMVIPLFVSGQLSPNDYAQCVMDCTRFALFIEHWVNRPLGGRSLGKKRKHSEASRSVTDPAA